MTAAAVVAVVNGSAAGRRAYVAGARLRVGSCPWSGEGACLMTV